MNKVVLVDGIRTPFCKSFGKLKELDARHLGKAVLQELLEKVDLPPRHVDEVIWGCNYAPADSLNIARTIALKAGLPHGTPAYTVQRNDASGMQAIASACLQLSTGQAQVVLAGACESVSNYPLFYDAGFQEWYRRRENSPENLLQKLPVGELPAAVKQAAATPVDSNALIFNDYLSGKSHQAVAESLANEFQLSRQALDEVSADSHRKATHAQNQNIFKEEIVPLYPGPHYSEVVDRDDCINDGLNAAALAKQTPFFGEFGLTTPGNCAALADGAASLLLMNEKSARALSLEPIATVRAYAVSAQEIGMAGIAPVYAIARVLKAAGLSMNDIDFFDINESFAATLLASRRLLADKKFMETLLGKPQVLANDNGNRLNPYGGALALGDPVGTTTLRQVISQAYALRRHQKKFALATTGGSSGQAMAIVLERWQGG